MFLFRWISDALRRKLRVRLLFSNIITLFFFLTLVGYLSFKSAQYALSKEVYEANRVLATNAARDINAQYDTIVTNVRFLASQLGASAANQTYQARTILDLRLNAPLTYHAIYLFGSQNNLMYLTEPLESLLEIRDVNQIVNRPPIPIDVQVNAAYEVAQNGFFYISNTYIMGADQVPTVFMSTLIKPSNGMSNQTLVIEIDLRSIWRRIDEIYIGQTGRAFVVSEDGLIIAHPDRSYINQPLALELMPVLDGYEGRAEYTDPFNGRIMLAAYSPVGRQSDWGLVVEQERSEALEPINRIAYIAMVAVLLAVALAIFVTVLMGQSIVRPILHLSEVTRRIAQTGDLSQRVTVDREDEVGQLAGTFNQMIDSLGRADKQLKEYSEQLEEMVEKRTQELQDAQEQLIRQEKLAVLGQLAGGVGHELRNPLGAISNSVYLLRLVLDEPNDTALEYLNIISDEVNIADKIVEDLLDFARTKGPARMATDVKSLVELVLSRLAIPGSIHPIIQINQDLPAVFIDHSQISMVLINILTNAFQSMPDGGDLGIKASDDEGFIVLSIIDSGIGIPVENLNKIFQPLFTTKTRGIGLGLAISKNLVEANGGSILVESQVGKGSTFSLLLPKITQ